MSEVQVVSTVLSADQENDPGILSIIGASAALSISPIPWDGPVGAARVGLVDGTLVINPTFSDLENSELDMVVAGTADAIIDGRRRGRRDRRGAAARRHDAAHEEIKRICAFQQELVGRSRQGEVGVRGAGQGRGLDGRRRELPRQSADRLRSTIPTRSCASKAPTSSNWKLREHFAVAPEGGRRSTRRPRSARRSIRSSRKRSAAQSCENGTRPDGRNADRDSADLDSRLDTCREHTVRRSSPAARRR